MEKSSIISKYSISNYFQKNTAYVFVLIVCPIFVYLYMKNLSYFLALGFKNHLPDLNLLTFFMLYIYDVFTIVLNYVFPLLFVIFLLKFFITTYKGKKYSFGELKKLPKPTKKIFRLSNKVQQYLIKNEISIYKFRHILIIIMVFFYISIVAIAHDVGQKQGIKEAELTIEGVKTGKNKPTPITLENEVINIFTILCDSNICSGIQVISDEKDKKIKYESRNYKAEYYSKSLVI